VRKVHFFNRAVEKNQKYVRPAYNAGFHSDCSANFFGDSNRRINGDFTADNFHYARRWINATEQKFCIKNVASFPAALASR
jgi:hypothetical protein